MNDYDGYVWLPLVVKGQLESVRVPYVFNRGLPPSIERFVSQPYGAKVSRREDELMKRPACLPMSFHLFTAVMPNGCRVPIYAESKDDPDLIRLAEAFWANAGRPLHLY